jgi:protocatechuate 3,4-dioxygenase beta subunit
MVVVEYQENDIYLASNATNESAIGTPTEEVVVIDVGKIPTKTMVEILNNTLGNVTIQVKVTNMTDKNVTTGQIFVKQEDKIIANEFLDHGMATLTIPAKEAGIIKVVVEYQENEIYLASKATNESASGTPDEDITVIDVTKIPTITSVEIINTTLGNVTIGVNVTNTTMNLVTIGTVVIKDESGNEITSENLTDGTTTITIPVVGAGECRVIVEYQENDYYLASNATNKSASGTKDENVIVIDVNKIPTKTMVEILNTTLTNVTIEVSVTNMTDEAVTEGEVIVFDTQGNKLTNATLSDGKATITVPADKAGDLKVFVEYPENKVYLPSNAKNESATNPDEEDIIVIGVTKIPTITNAEVLNNTVGNVTIGVNVTNMTGKNVIKGTIVVKDIMGNELVTKGLSDGFATINVPCDESGKLIVIVEYQENDIYMASNATNESAIDTPVENIIVIDVTERESQITVDTNSPVKAFENVTISGALTDVDGTPIAEADVEVYVDGKIIDKVTTDSNGNYELNTTAPVGTHDVEVYYLGDSKYDPASDSTEFTVEQLAVEVEASAIESNPVNTTIKVNATDEDDNPVNNVPVLIKDEDGNIIGNGTLNNGTVNITVPLGPGEHLLTIETEQTDDYEASSTKLEVVVPKFDTNLTVDEVEDVTVGEEVTISGRLTDEFGNAIAGADITVTVNGEDIETTTDDEGNYEVTYPADTLGQNKVTVTYPGDDEHEASTTNSTFDVNKVQLEAEVTPTDVNPVNTTVEVKVTDADKNPVDNIPVIVKDENGTVIGNGTVNNGIVNITVPLEPGEHNITVESNASDDYEGFSQKVPVVVPKYDTNLTVDPIEDATIGDNVTISGTLTDENGNPIPGAEVTINVNGEDISVVTDNDGKFNHTYPVDTIGENNITVTYPGDKLHEPTSTNTTFNVDKIPTKTSVDILNTTIGNVTIAVSVTNLTDVPVTEGTVIVNDVDGNELANATLSGGKANITIPCDESGKLLVQVEYQENDIYLASNATNSSAEGKPTENIIIIDVVKDASKLTVDATSPVKTHDDVTINGTLKDSYGNPIAGAPIEVSVDGVVIANTTTDENGNYEVDTTATTGTHKVTVEYPGSEAYEPAKESTEYTVEKLDADVDASVIDTNPTNTTVDVVVTDENGDPVDDVPVVIKDEDGNVIGNGTVTNGTVNITVPLEPGKHNITIEIDGNDDYEPTTITVPVDVPKHNTTITPDPITNTGYGNTTQISGKLTDENGNPVANANVTITVNGEEIPVQTDENGVYNYTYPADTVGVNNVTVKYDGDNAHEATEVDSEFEVSKAGVSITVNPVETFVEENITLQANITDANGDKVSEGEVIFKINGITIKEGGKLSDADVLRVPVVDGVAKYTFNATKELLGSKNITAVYIANEHYAENRTDGTTPANVSLRTAQVIASTQPAIGKQRHNITLVADVYDITHNLRDVRPINSNGSYVVFKVNGITVKDADGNALKVPVVDGVAKTDYYIPNGMGGIKSNGAYKNYTVTAVYHHPDYYDVRNTSNFNIERAYDVSFDVDDVSLDNRTVSISGNLVESDGDNLVGTNVIGVKVNGLTLKDKDGKPVLFNSTDGKFDIDFKLPDNVKEVKNITLTTGNREAYGSAKTTITDISKQASVITVADVTGIVEENITLSARVTDKYGNPLSGGYVI